MLWYVIGNSPLAILIGYVMPDAVRNSIVYKTHADTVNLILVSSSLDKV